MSETPPFGVFIEVIAKATVLMLALAGFVGAVVLFKWMVQAL